MSQPKSPAGSKPSPPLTPRAEKAKNAYKGNDAFSTASLDPESHKQLVALQAELQESPAAEKAKRNGKGIGWKKYLKFFDK